MALGSGWAGGTVLLLALKRLLSEKRSENAELAPGASEMSLQQDRLPSLEEEETALRAAPLRPVGVCPAAARG